MSDAVTAEVRRLHARDWTTIRQLRLEALRDAPEAFGGNYAQSAARSPGEWRGWPGGGPVFGAFVNGDPVGMVAGAWPHGEAGEPELIAMWVARSWRGHGIAGQLVAALAAWAAGTQSSWLYLEVKPHNQAARASYLRAGFEHCDQPGSGDRANVTMRLDLSRMAR